jgi:hypothetical protein
VFAVFTYGLQAIAINWSYFYEKKSNNIFLSLYMDDPFLTWPPRYVVSGSLLGISCCGSVNVLKFSLQTRSGVSLLGARCLKSRQGD